MVNSAQELPLSELLEQGFLSEAKREEALLKVVVLSGLQQLEQMAMR